MNSKQKANSNGDLTAKEVACIALSWHGYTDCQTIAYLGHVTHSMRRHELKIMRGIGSDVACCILHVPSGVSVVACERSQKLSQRKAAAKLRTIVSVPSAKLVWEILECRDHVRQYLKHGLPPDARADVKHIWCGACRRWIDNVPCLACQLRGRIPVMPRSEAHE